MFGSNTIWMKSCNAVTQPVFHKDKDKEKDKDNGRSTIIRMKSCNAVT